MTTNGSQASRGTISRGLILAGLLLAASVALKLLSPDYLSPELARRLLGVLMGTVVVVYANAVPKALSPLIQMRCDPAAEQAIRRFVGWGLALGGAAYAVAWVIAPIEDASVLSASFLGTALLLILARLAWGRARGRRP